MGSYSRTSYRELLVLSLDVTMLKEGNEWGSNIVSWSFETQNRRAPTKKRQHHGHQSLIGTSAMEEELQPYQFLQTDYNKASFTLTNDKTTASCIDGDVYGYYLSMTRSIGRDHRLILKILGSRDVRFNFTTCDTASLLTNDKHLNHLCGTDCCNGRNVTDAKTIRGESFVIMRRTSDNRIEAVVSDASGSSITELWDMDVTADVPVLPVVNFCKEWQNVQILPDETGLQSVRSQIDALQAAVIAKHVLIALRTNWNNWKALSAVKAELPADRDYKIQGFENKIREKAYAYSPSWLSNDSVVVRDGVMQRIGDIHQKNYSFRSTPFAAGTRMKFVINRMSKPFCESLTFGVTVHSPDHLDMQSLPTNGSKLKENSTAENWHVANDFVPFPQENQIICLMRTSAGVVMKTDTDPWATDEPLLFPVNSLTRVFPFFILDGSVKAIQMLEVKHCDYIRDCDVYRSGSSI